MSASPGASSSHLAQAHEHYCPGPLPPQLQTGLAESVVTTADLLLFWQDSSLVVIRCAAPWHRRSRGALWGQPLEWHCTTPLPDAQAELSRLAVYANEDVYC